MHGGSLPGTIAFDLFCGVVLGSYRLSPDKRCQCLGPARDRSIVGHSVEIGGKILRQTNGSRRYYQIA